jgi:hypothetical protein
LVEGAEAVLRHDEPFALPRPWTLVLALLAIPAFCGGWYAMWRRRNPDAARRARTRQSRAARQALHALTAVPQDTPAHAAHPAAAIVADYLRQRWDLAAVEPTPAEVAANLLRQGCAELLANRAAAFFRDCDRARFAPEPAPGPDQLTTAAADLVHSLEGQPCSERTS